MAVEFQYVWNKERKNFKNTVVGNFSIWIIFAVFVIQVTLTKVNFQQKNIAAINIELYVLGRQETEKPLGTKC